MQLWCFLSSVLGEYVTLVCACVLSDVAHLNGIVAVASVSVQSSVLWKREKKQQPTKICRIKCVRECACFCSCPVAYPGFHSPRILERQVINDVRSSTGERCSLLECDCSHRTFGCYKRQSIAPPQVLLHLESPYLTVLTCVVYVRRCLRLISSSITDA